MKHTVFGQVVGGMHVLKLMEQVPTYIIDKPKTEIKINDIAVFVDPFQNIMDKLGQEEANKLAEIAKKKANVSFRVDLF